MESKLNIYDGEEFLGTADVSEGGRWSFKAENLSTREYVFKAETSSSDIKSESWMIAVQQPPLYENFESGTGGIIDRGGSMEFPTMTVTNESPPGDGGVTVGLFQEHPPMITGRSLVLWAQTGARTRVSLQFKRGAKSVKFGLSSTSKRLVANVWCYSNVGTVICQGSTPQFGAADAVWAEFSPRAPYENELITTVVIEGPRERGFSIDNFTLS